MASNSVSKIILEVDLKQAKKMICARWSVCGGEKNQLIQVENLLIILDLQEYLQRTTCI